MCSYLRTYVVYKPWLQGVFNKYTTKSNVVGSLPLTLSLKGKGLISALPMTENEGHIFVEYTIEAVHGSYDIIYTMMKTLTNKITIKVSTFSHESNDSSDAT